MPGSAQEASAARGASPGVAEVRVDPQGRIVHWSGAAAEWFGHAAAEMEGRPVHDLVRPAPDAVWPDAARGARPSVGSASGVGIPAGPADAVRADGVHVPVRVSVSFDDGLVLRLEDDAPARRAWQRIRQSEEQLRRAQQVGRIGSWEWDIAADRIDWSDELYRIYGVEPQSFEATFEAFLERVHADERATVQRMVEEALQDQSGFRFFHRIVRPDGAVRWLYGQGAVESEGGQPVRMHGTAQDVTEIRAAEDKFRALLDSAPDAIVLADAEGRIELVNEQVEHLFGYGRDELVGRPVEVLVPPSLREGHRGHRSDYNAHPKKRPMGRGLELKAVRKDGSEFPVEVSLSPIKTPDGTLVMAAVRDISERRKAEEADRLAFQRLLEIQQLKELNRFRTDLLNTASHELNTPLTPLRLELHLLRSGRLGDLNERQERAVEVLDRNLQRVSGLIEDVLDVARMESGRMRIERKPMDLAKLVAEAAQTYRPAVQEAGLTLDLDLEGPVPMEGDPDRLSQVLVNLLSNAVKFTEQGGITLTLRRVRRDGRPEAEVEVADTGVGLDGQQIKRLFQPFSQVHDVNRSQLGGTGLGLYICKGILQEHGGSVSVDSEGPGRGTTFTLRLPMEGAP